MDGNGMDMVERLTRVEERSKSNTKRIDALEKEQEAIHSLAASVAVMAQNQETMSKDVNAIKDKVENLAPASVIETVKKDLDEIKAKPGKRWETVVTCAVTAIVAGVIGYFLSKLGIT